MYHIQFKEGEMWDWEDPQNEILQLQIILWMKTERSLKDLV